MVADVDAVDRIAFGIIFLAVERTPLGALRSHDIYIYKVAEKSGGGNDEETREQGARLFHQEESS